MNSPGQGGFGEVRLVRHRLDGKRYAIKIIQLKKDQPALNKEIEKEAVTLANLQHHRIVQYKFVRLNYAFDGLGILVGILVIVITRISCL